MPTVELTEEEWRDVQFRRIMRQVETEKAEVSAIVARKYPLDKLSTMFRHRELVNQIIMRRERERRRRANQ